MKNCKYCGAVNPAEVFNCLKCNAQMPTPAAVRNVPVLQLKRPKAVQVQSQPVETSGKDWLIYFGVTFLVILLASGMFYVLNRLQPDAPAVKTQSSSSKSGSRTIKTPGGILVATTEESFDQMMRAARLDDDDSLKRMSQAGMVFRLQEGTTINIIGGGLSKSKITAIDGFYAGRAGWLPNEFIGD